MALVAKKGSTLPMWIAKGDVDRGLHDLRMCDPRKRRADDE